MATTRKAAVPEVEPYTFEVDGEKYEMPTYDPTLFTPRDISFPEACELKARMTLDEYEQYRLEILFGNLQGAVKAHLTSAEHVPAALAIARLIESSAEQGFKGFFDFFNAWTAHDGAKVVDEPGESSGSQES